MKNDSLLHSPTTMPPIELLKVAVGTVFQSNTEELLSTSLVNVLAVKLAGAPYASSAFAMRASVIPVDRLMTGCQLAGDVAPGGSRIQVPSCDRRLGSDELSPRTPYAPVTPS